MILRTVAELPRGHHAGWRWCRRRWGSGSRPSAGTAAYGVPSVLAQLACDVRVLRPVSRTVFHPVPNVDSVLVGLTRRGPAPEPGLRTLVQQAFAHRRKALARSLSLAPGAAPGIRDRARAALEAIGRPADARAEQLAPDGVARPLRGAARMTALRCLAPGKVNICLFIGRARDDGYHPLVSLVQPVSLADELVLTPRRRRRRRGGLPGRRGREPRRARARPLPRGDRLGRPAGAHHDRQARPGRRRHGRRLGGRRRRAAARRGRRRARPHATRRCTASPSSLGADVPSQLAPERCLMTGIGEGVRRLGDPRPVRPADRARPTTRSRRPRSTASSTASVSAATRTSSTGSAARCRAPRATRRCSPSGCCTTTSRRPPARSARRSATRSPTCARPARCARWSPAPARRCSACSPAPTASTHAQAAAAALRERHPHAVAATPVGRGVRRAAWRPEPCTPPGSRARVALTLYLVIRRRAPRQGHARRRRARGGRRAPDRLRRDRAAERRAPASRTPARRSASGPTSLVGAPRVPRDRRVHRPHRTRRDDGDRRRARRRPGRDLADGADRDRVDLRGARRRHVVHARAAGSAASSWSSTARA